LFSSLSSIRLSSSSTISLGSGSTIEGALIYRDGMTFPATDASAFAGVAITAAGDDATVLHSMILGFATAFTSTGFNRQTLDSVLFDCTNGIIISNCQDVAKLHQCHGWPFSIAPGSPTVTTQRAGYAFQYKNVGDWNKITDCFSFGYFRGFNVSSADHCVLLGCGADSFVGYTGSVGILVDGTSADTALVACQAAAQERGIVVITTAPLGNHTTLTDCQTWGNTISGLQVHTGDATVTGGSYRTTDSGIVVSGTSSVWVDRVRFENIVTAPINCTVNTSTVYIGDHNDFTGWVGPVANNVNRPMATIDSATTITLPTNGNHFVVLGTTTIAGLLGGWAGRQLTLIFTGTLTVTHSTGLYLKGATNRSATAGHTMRLIHDSTNWYEV
jgi:hypothetical protein